MGCCCSKRKQLLLDIEPETQMCAGLIIEGELVIVCTNEGAPLCAEHECIAAASRGCRNLRIPYSTACFAHAAESERAEFRANIPAEFHQLYLAGKCFAAVPERCQEPLGDPTAIYCAEHSCIRCKKYKSPFRAGACIDCKCSVEECDCYRLIIGRNKFDLCYKHVRFGSRRPNISESVQLDIRN